MTGNGAPPTFYRIQILALDGASWNDLGGVGWAANLEAGRRLLEDFRDRGLGQQFRLIEVTSKVVE